MTIEFIWQLPTSGDGRHGDATHARRGERTGLTRPPFTEGVSDPRGKSFNFLDHLHQIARAADLAGFDGIQIQNDLKGDESWIVAGYLARSSSKLKFLTEFEASRGSAVYAAKNAASFQRFTGGRFAWQLSVGPNPETRRQHGDYAEEADLLPRIGEFVEVAKGVLTQSPYSFKGKFFEVLDGGFNGPLSNRPVPEVYLSGNSPEALELSAQWADVHVLDAAPVEELESIISELKQQAADKGRAIRFGLRIDVLARETEDEALHDAQRYLAQTGRAVGSSDPVVVPGLWAGFATDRTGAKASLVGSYGNVAERLVKYAEAGISSFILAAIPHFEETYRIGEHVLPVVRARIETKLAKAA